MTFEKYENDADRINQTGVKDALMHYLSGFPVVGTGLDGVSHFTAHETPMNQNLPQDVDIYHHGRYVAVAEIKCRTGKYTLDYFKSNGVMLEQRTLTKLREQHHRLGRHVLLVIRTSDNNIVFATMQGILFHAKAITTAPMGACKDNHGEQDTDRVGLIIPFHLFREIPL